MITSVVGRLIKKPELIERIHIPGKHVVAFTIVQNSQRGDKRVSVFFNLSTVVATEAQFEMVMRLEKGTVLLFSAPRITYVKQADRDDREQVINLYAEIDNFRIVAGAQAGGADSSSPPSSPHPADAAVAFEEGQEAPLPPQQRRAAGPRVEGPRPSASTNASGTTAARRRASGGDEGHEAASGLDAADAVADVADMSDLSDPFDGEPPPPAPARRPAAGAARGGEALSPAQAGAKRTTPPTAPQKPPRPRPEPQEIPEDDDPFA